MRLFLILTFNIFITSVHGFFYTLLPVVILEHTDKTTRAYCPWNLVKDEKLVCNINKDVIGYTYSDPASVTTPAVPRPYKFINPTLQEWFTEDNCAKLKKEWPTYSSSANSCKVFSSCFNVGKDRSLCTCQSGFFGDPYTGCKQHCFTEDDCTSPVATCGHDKNNSATLSRCVCKPGYNGDGVMCHINPCGTNRLAKCDGGRICVPTGPNERDFKCMCPAGHYVDHNNKCVPEVKLEKDTVITLVGKNVEDGSRVELGDCLSFTLNDGNKSMFFHKNSGDSVYVKKTINNPKQFSLFYILTDEVTVFSSVKDSGFGLSKLYSMTNIHMDCKFGHVKIFDPAGHEVSDEEVFKKLQQKTTTSRPQSVQNNPGSTESRTDQTTTQTKVQPVVEVYVRQLTEGEKSGGLSGFKLPSSMLKLATEGISQATGSQSISPESGPSQLQTGVSTSSDKSEL